VSQFSNFVNAAKRLLRFRQRDLPESCKLDDSVGRFRSQRSTSGKSNLDYCLIGTEKTSRVHRRNGQNSGRDDGEQSIASYDTRYE